MSALDVHSSDALIEIGSGHGELTNKLLAVSFELLGKDRPATKIIAIEKDKQLAKELKEKFSNNAAVNVVEGDALKILPDVIKGYKLKAKSYKLAGNIPYYITGHLLRTIGALPNKPERCVFTIQKEVAERIVAKPPRMNRLAASVQFWANPEILGGISRHLFRPPPEVDSAIIRLMTINPPADEKAAISFNQILPILFRQPRKTIFNNLRARFPQDEVHKNLRQIGAESNARPQDLSIDQIIHLARLWN